MDCKHEIEKLMGTADGIVCRGCGRLFKNFNEIHPETEAAAQEAPKRAPRKKKEEA